MVDVQVVAEFGHGMLSFPRWDEFAASAGTAFHTSRFLLPWWKQRQAKNPNSRLVTASIVDADDVVGLCAFELEADSLSFAGGRDVVDYMGPIAAAGREKEVAAALGEWLFESLSWNRAHLAGLAADAAAANAMLDEVLRRAPCASAETYDQAPRIEKTPEGYLKALNAKRRADVLRKRNRLVEAVGQLELVASTRETTLELLERLLSWKAQTGAATSAFVAEYGDFLREMLTGLATAGTGQIVELRASDRPLASAIMLRHRDTAYIYNMSYDMSLTAESSLAPGVVLVSLLVERSLDSGLRFDFLKGAQDYKLRLGGVPVGLTAVTVER